ncbi:hypothetical protein B0H14DRAFT_2567330 [Mycena olivaceomarginata]|nr:hypothetical protein B0H14DRAFT_2567330 [Mycena olivaceomarginata]
MTGDCTIPSNPDVSGIGVRAAIYAQNLTCFLPVIVHLWDGKISRDELKGIKDQSIGMLAVAFAILLTTIILAKGAGGDQTITSYHAAVATGANWSEWRDALLEPVRELLGRNDGPGTSPEVTSTVQRRRGIALRIWRITQRIWRIAQRIWRIAKRIWHFVSKQPVLTLGSIHLSLMAAVGIWLWSDPSKFGQPLRNCDPTLTVVGVPARFSSQPLRIVSLTMYAIVLIPGLNLIPPFVFFLALHISYNWCLGHHQSSSPDIERQPPHPSPSIQDTNPNSPSTSNHRAQPQPSESSPGLPSSDVELLPRRSSAHLSSIPVVSETVTQPRTAPDTEQGGPSQRSSTAVYSGVAQPETTDSSPNTALPPASNPAVFEAVTQPGTSGPSPHTAFLIVGLVLLVAINILFIVDIELTLRRNKGDQNGDEATWGFGQVLALLLLIIPLRDAWGALQDIGEKLKGIQGQFEQLLLRECQATPVVEELEHLIQRDANPHLSPADSRFINFLQLVAYYGKIELVQFFLGKGIEDMPGGQFQTALQSAAARGHLLVVKILLQSKRYAERLNEIGGDYGTALCAASANGKFEVVNALLDAGAARKGNENREMVEFLIGDNPMFDPSQFLMPNALGGVIIERLDFFLVKFREIWPGESPGAKNQNGIIFLVWMIIKMLNFFGASPGAFPFESQCNSIVYFEWGHRGDMTCLWCGSLRCHVFVKTDITHTGPKKNCFLIPGRMTRKLLIWIWMN